MDKKEAIELLKRYLTEIPELRNRPNEEAYERWVNRVTIVIEAGLEQENLNTFISDNYVIPFSFPSSNSRGGYVKPQPTYYKERITVKEIALKKVIDKYELLGTETEHSLIEVPPESIFREVSPKAFIAHEGMTGSLQKIKDLLDALGVKYLIAEIEPSDGRGIERQVQWTQGEADFAIILATKGKVINKDTGKPYMGMNVADELGRAREVFKNRIILLLQKGVEPHTNISGIVYEPFTPQNREKAFIKIIKELRNWGFIVVSQQSRSKTLE